MTTAGVAVGTVDDDPGAPLDGRAVGAHGDALAGQHDHRRSVVVDGGLPGGRRLVGVGRADHLELRDGAQRGQVLDRLVRRAVLADADGVVAEDEHRPWLRERGQADGRAHVVEEDEERAADGEDPAVLGHADHRRTHGVLADRRSGRWRPPGGLCGLHAGVVGELGAGVAGEVGGARRRCRGSGRARPEHLDHGLAGGDAPRPARTSAATSSHPLSPVLRPRRVPRGALVRSELVERRPPTARRRRGSAPWRRSGRRRRRPAATRTARPGCP